jgi:hypothetical protein
VRRGHAPLQLAERLALAGTNLRETQLGAFEGAGDAVQEGSDVARIRIRIVQGGREE